MIKHIFITCKKNKFTSFITIIALTIFIFSSSIIYSIIKDTLSQTIDSNKVNNNLLSVTFNANKNVSFNEVYKDLFSKLNNETVLVDLGQVVINGIKSARLFAIDFKDKPYLDVNILNGRNFYQDDLQKKHALVGIKLAECLTISNDKKYIEISNEKYEVIGIIGNNETNSPYDLSIYIPLKSLPKNINETLFKSFQFSVRSNDNSDETIETVLKNSSIRESYHFKKISKANFLSTILSNYEFNMNTINMLFLTGIISFFNLFIISNIWIDTKKYEISIKKALGASNRIIAKEFFFLILLFSLFSSIIASILEILFSKMINDFFFIYLNVTLKTMALVSLFSILIAMIITLYQVKKITKVSITDYIQD